MQIDSPQSNICSQKCISSTETPCTLHKNIENRKNKKKYSLFIAGSICSKEISCSLFIKCLSLKSSATDHSMTMTMKMKVCLLPLIYTYTKYRMQDINALKISIKHFSVSCSIHVKGGTKPRLMCPNFCFTIENISFWGCRKQEMVQSDRRMASFFFY